MGGVRFFLGGWIWMMYKFMSDISYLAGGFK